MNYPGLKSGVSKLSPLPGLTATLPPWGTGMYSAEAAWFFHRTEQHTIRKKSTGVITTPDSCPLWGKDGVSDRKVAVTNQNAYICFTPQLSCEEFF